MNQPAHIYGTPEINDKMDHFLWIPMDTLKLSEGNHELGKIWGAQIGGKTRDRSLRLHLKSFNKEKNPDFT